MHISLITSPSNKDLLPPSQIAHALSARFPLVGADVPARTLAAGDVLLIVGAGRWACDDVVRELQVAGSRNVKRVLWQLEPLPPPVDGMASSILQADFRNARRQRHSRAALSKLSSAAAASILKATWLLAMVGGKHVHANVRQAKGLLSYPLKQARDIVSLKRDGLLDHVLVSVASRKMFLAQYGVSSEFVPVGFAPEFGSALPNIERDVDVLFLGYVTERRRDLLASLQSQLRRHGRKIHVVERNCYGDERTRLLNRSKIVLNLQRFPWEFPIIRLLMAMGCKTLVVSERASDPGPFVEDKHVILRNVSDLGEALVTYLANDEKRSLIVDEAHAYVTTEFTLANLLSDALASIAAPSTSGR
jgi:glycosyltransferase involved in cell wall biosynthesis